MGKEVTYKVGRLIPTRTQENLIRRKIRQARRGARVLPFDGYRASSGQCCACCWACEFDVGECCQGEGEEGEGGGGQEGQGSEEHCQSMEADRMERTEQERWFSWGYVTVGVH